MKTKLEKALSEVRDLKMLLERGMDGLVSIEAELDLLASELPEEESTF